MDQHFILFKVQGNHHQGIEGSAVTFKNPAYFTDNDGSIQCDSSGSMNLLDGSTGKILDNLELASNIEASPAIFNDMAVVATRGGKIYGVKIK